MASKYHGTSYGKHPVKHGSLGVDVADSTTESCALVSKAKRWVGNAQISAVTMSDNAALVRTLGLPDGLHDESTHH